MKIKVSLYVLHLQSLVLIMCHDLCALLTVSLLKVMEPLHSLKAGWFVKRPLGVLSWFDP